MKKSIHEGPWFVVGGFLSVTQREPNFVSCTSTITHIVIWVRLPQLPTEFYDQQILERIGKKLELLLRIDSCTSSTLGDRYERIGKKLELLLRIDSCTSSTLENRYARICIQITLENLMKKFFTIENNTQAV